MSHKELDARITIKNLIYLLINKIKKVMHALVYIFG